MLFYQLTNALNLSKLFWGSFEDQVYLGTFSWWSKVWPAYSDSIFFNPLLGLYGFRYEVTNTNQPLIWYVVSFGYYLFEQNFFYNLLVIAIFVLNFVCSFKVFSKISDKAVGITLFQSVAFAFCPYVLIHSGRHLDLSLVALIPIFFYQLLQLFDTDISLDKTKSIFKKLFVITLVQTLISNYYGYFMLLTTSIVTVLKTLTLLKSWPKMRTFDQNAIYATRTFSSRESFAHNTKILPFNIKSWAILIVSYYLLLILSLIIILFPYVQRVYLGEKSEFSGVQYTRPFDDFITFSSRPWFFVLPPANNPVIGTATTQVLTWLNNSKDYFLFKDYFMLEHGGNFLGFANILLFIAALLIVKPRKQILIYLTLCGLLFLFAMPPYFTINTHIVYTPSFVLYKVFPMFRSINRLSIFILFIVLVITTRLLVQLRTKNPKALALTLAFLTILLGVDYAYPVRIQQVGTAPAIYSYIADNLPKDAALVFYPSRKSTVYWSKVFKRKYLNPDGYVANEFNSDAFTDNLPTPLGVTSLLKTSANFLVVFKDAKQADQTFFAGNAILKPIAETKEAVIYEISQ